MSKTNPNHPKALEAAERSRKVQAMREAAKAHKICFLHVGIYTLAYRIDRRSVVELSTAIRNPTDRHNTAEGRLVAFERFQAQNRILLHLEPGSKGDIQRQLAFAFGIALSPDRGL